MADPSGILSFPRLQQAIRLPRDFAEVDALARLSRCVLDRVPVGVLLLDGVGCPAVMNCAAEEILALRDGLSVTASGLQTWSPKENKALSRLVLQAAREERYEGGLLAVSRPSLKRPFLLEVEPYATRRSDAGGGHVSVAVFVSDPEAFMAPSHLGCAFGLTPAEEALAVRLGQGETLEIAADGLGISLNTARTHLKHIFAKTGVGRQSELIRLLLTGVTGLRPSRCSHVIARPLRAEAPRSIRGAESLRRRRGRRPPR
jgi:DNA-binding CsgD family transcriptional regulator